VNGKLKIDSKFIINILCFSCSVIFIYTAAFGMFSVTTQRSLLLLLLGPVVFLSYASEEKDDTLELKPLNLINAFMALALVVTNIYVIMTWKNKILMTGESTLIDLVIGTILIIVILEATRQSTGLFLAGTALVCIVYALFGPYMPGFIAHRGETWDRIVNYILTSPDGIYGTPLGIAASYVIIFVIFGAMLEVYGGGQLFIDVAYSIAGKFRGGPGKAAVVASALMGMISGAPAANVSTVGTFTIPLMKKVGYDPDVSAASVSVAATGGMFTPPIMGAGAFIMAEYLGVPYLKVCIAAIVPCILYYLALFLLVDAQAVKSGLVGLPASELPDVKKALKERGQLGLPIVFLFAAIIIGWSPVKAAFWAIIVTIVVGSLKKDTRPKLKDVLAALTKASRSVVPIVVTCAAAGIITGVFSITGIGAKLSYSLGFLTGVNGGVLIAGVIAGIIALLLGAPLPPTAVYLVMVPTIIPAIINIGINPVAAHMFVFIYAAVGALTPPVAITAYTAAAIAKSDPNKTSWLACRYGAVAYLVPFAFLLAPSILFIGDWQTILIAIVSSVIGVFCLTIAIEGYFLMNWSKVARILIIPAAVLFMVPGYKFNLLALVIFGAVYFVNKSVVKKVSESF
jgi:TRAP transporter 4TM/12TM fusion protein